MSVGWRHQCGITTDHALRCWSSHATFDGGCYAGPGACGRDPLPIEGRFVEVSAGAQHTCARSEDGEVLCFGARDTAAWLSNPTESLTNLDTEPSGGVQGWSCGLNAEGFARCWGA
ncbi:MAG: RCC1 domain-containing protein, partial [Polyangiales bacterium]